VAVAQIRPEPNRQGYSYEEIRKVVAELLSGKVRGPYPLDQYNSLRENVTRILNERQGGRPDNWVHVPALTEQDRELL
jgi:hypothetical protein